MPQQHPKLASIWQMTTPSAPRRPALSEDLTVDVAVVGAGITGLTAALRLAREGKKVVVLEAMEVAAGTTGYTTAHLTAVYDHDYATLEKVYGKESAQLVCRSMTEAIDAIERIAVEHEIDCDFKRVSGYLYAETSDDVETVQKELEASRRAGIEATLAAHVPLPFETAIGFEARNQAQLHPTRYLRGLAEAVERAGGVIYEGTRVTSVQDGEPCRLRTSGGCTVIAPRAILATHTPLGKNLLHGLLPPYRSYVIAFTVRGEAPVGLFWDTAEPYNYTRSAEIDGETVVIVGGKDRKTGHGPEEESLDALEEYVRRRFDVAEIRARWGAQFYENTDHLPYVGKSPLATNVYVASGFSGDGMTLGTAAGLILADQVVGLETPYDELYKPARVHLAGFTTLIHESLDVAKAFVKDRLPLGHKPDLERLAPGEGAILGSGWAPLAAYRADDGEVRTFSAVCPHMKCVVRWNAQQKSFDCPCHGSRFDTRGRCLEGPALQGLSPAPASEGSRRARESATGAGAPPP